MKRRLNFSGFTLDEAFKYLNIKKLYPWNIEYTPRSKSAFFQERLRRLEHFDLSVSEHAKELLIDAVCEEALEHHDGLKIWKSASLESDEFRGKVDYLFAPKRAYLEGPLLCVAEAKKDDFSQGLAQCLVEMKACLWNNEQLGEKTGVFGIVSNGTIWEFYKWTSNQKVYQSPAYSLVDIERLLGILDFIFKECEDVLVLQRGN